MSEISGIGGTATLANVTINVKEWSATIEKDEVAIPPTMSVTPPWEYGVPGAQRLSGSLIGTIDTGTVPIDITAHTNLSGAAVLTAHTGKTISSDVLYSSLKIDRNLADVTVSVDFRNSGAFTTW